MARISRRLNPCSYLPRRMQVVAALLFFFLIALIFIGTSNRTHPYLDHVPYGSELHAGAHQAADAAHQMVDSIPSELNVFRTPAHKPPPEQANSTSGDTKWFTDFKWENPWSSSITLDEDRSVLPPEKNRPSIYTYYDPKEKKNDVRIRKAELELVNIWRRAWWAKGFKPVVLGLGEAMNNPMYQQAMALNLSPELEFDMLRWLAWGNMGTGILSNWLALPMAPYNDAFFEFLRRGDFPVLSSYPDLADGFYVGSKADIDKAIKSALNSKDFKEAKTFPQVMPPRTVREDIPADSVAYYSGNNIANIYQPIREKIVEHNTLADGLADLAALINSHLHTTWQSQFSKGIYVLKPMPQRTTNLIQPAIDVALNLSRCSISPLPNSCPPNNQKCRTCVASQPLALSTPPVFRNWTDVFTIATIPHPYTLNCLYHQREGLNLKFVRRQTTRDKWILEATKELLGTGLSSFARLVSLKDAVASDFSQSRTLWLTAESPLDAKDHKDAEELDWILGFQIPRSLLGSGKSETPVPGPERRPPPPKLEFGDVEPLSDSELGAEKKRLQSSQQFIEKAAKKSEKETRELKELVEAWNLADTEAWKFVRAYNARRHIERQKWQEEEETFLGQGTWNRLVEKLTMKF